MSVEGREIAKDVHTEHCCIICGCKYGKEDCPVALGIKPQSFPCEWHEDDDHQLHRLRDALGKLAEKWEAIEPNASNTVTHATVQACANQIRTLLAQASNASGTPTTEGES